MERLEALIERRVARIGVVGLGYVGLPLAVEFAKAGFPVVGIDVEKSKVERIARGENYIDDVREDDLRELVRTGRLSATTDWGIAADLDVLILCVPTPFNRNKEPDLSAVTEAARAAARRLRPGQFVVLESTTYPGTTEEVLLPILAESGLRVGTDFCLAYSPERVDPGNRLYQIPNTPKLVGGVTVRCGKLAALLYRAIVIKVLPVSSPRAAEMAKLLENIFRNVNIALVNELAMLCDRMRIDIWEVVEAAGTKPFGFMSFQPGPGVGGHCIPVDPVYLSWKAKEFDFYTNFIDLAAEVNANMPYFAAHKAARALAARGTPICGARVLVLGVTFKRDVGDVRNSSALRLMEILAADGAAVSYHDPHVPELTLRGAAMRSVDLTPAALREADCVLIHTDHSLFRWDSIVPHCRLVFDTRNATQGVPAGENVIVKL
ncbi:MAG: nucleotide sugar dehydrogenase [Candidatus Rokubacteria bacterium]|nr:nucleotide sugar dehydrogenase [Candidatus Rokubacteria bacterium]